MCSQLGARGVHAGLCLELGGGGRVFVGAVRAPPAQTPVSIRRDGPDQSAPQLGVFSGNTALETAYSSTNQVLLKFHSDFSNGGFFVLNFHGQWAFARRGDRVPLQFAPVLAGAWAPAEEPEGCPPSRGPSAASRPLCFIPSQPELCFLASVDSLPEEWVVEEARVHGRWGLHVRPTCVIADGARAAPRTWGREAE